MFIYGAVPAASGVGDFSAEVEGAAFLEGKFFAGQQVGSDAGVESGVAQHAVAAPVFAVEEGGGQQEVVPTTEEAFEGEFEAVVSAGAGIDQGVGEEAGKAGAGVDDGEGGDFLFYGDVEEVLVVGFYFKADFRGGVPIVAEHEVVAFEEADVGIVFEGVVVNGFVAVVVEVVGHALGVEAIAEVEVLVFAGLVGDAQSRLNGGEGVFVEVEIEGGEACHQGEAAVGFVLKLEEGLYFEGAVAGIPTPAPGVELEALVGQLMHGPDAVNEGKAEVVGLQAGFEAGALVDFAVDEEVGGEGVGAKGIVEYRRQAVIDEESVFDMPEDVFVMGAYTLVGSREGEFGEGVFVEGLRPGEAGYAHARPKELVHLVFGIEVGGFFGSFQVAFDDVHRAVAADAPEGDAAAVLGGEAEAEGGILVLGYGIGTYVDAEEAEELERRIAVREQIGRALVFVDGAFGQQLGAEEAQLAAEFMSFVVAVAHAQVEDTGDAIGKFRGKGAGEEVGVGQVFVVEDGYGASAGAGHGKVVGVGDVDAFESPEHALGGIAPHDDVVAAVVAALYAGKVGSHAPGVAPAAGIAFGFFNTELTGADGSHFVAGLSASLGDDFHFAERKRSFLHFDMEDDLLAGSQDDVAEHEVFISQVGELYGVAAQGDVFEAIAPVGIAGSAYDAFRQINYHIDPDERELALLVGDAAPDGLGEVLRKQRKGS